MLSYRKLAMRVLGRPLHTGGIDSPRPASQRAAAFILTAVMLDRKSTRLNSSHTDSSRMPSSA